MNIGDLKQFVGSLAILFANKTGNPQADMIAFGEALEPFEELSIPAFSEFLKNAKEYKETGIIPVSTGRAKRTSSSGTKAKKTPLKSKNDVDAIQKAVDELEKMYSHAADPDLTYAAIESTVKEIHDSFDAPGFKEVAKGFNLSSGIGSKKACREKIEHKIKERKERNERGQVIANAAKVDQPSESNQSDSEPDVFEAVVVE